MAYFSEILASENLTIFIRVISIGQASDSTVNLMMTILSHQTLLQLIKLPTVGVIRQCRQNEFITTLTGMDPRHTLSILPALEKIRLITKEEPYMSTQLFSELQKLHIDMESIQLPSSSVYPSLVGLYLRGAIDIDYLEGFLKNHHHIKQVHIAIVATLRPLGYSTGLVNLLRDILSRGLDAELSGSVMRYAESNAHGHERLLLRDIHAQLDKLEDRAAKELRKTIVAAFEMLLEYELNKYCEVIGKMQISTANPSQLEISSSIAYFWEDELAIKGAALPEDYPSKKGLWIHNEIKESLGMSLANQRINSTLDH